MRYGEILIEVRRKKPFQTVTVAWDDDEAIARVIDELNFGKYAEKA